MSASANDWLVIENAGQFNMIYSVSIFTGVRTKNITLSGTAASDGEVMIRCDTTGH